MKVLGRRAEGGESFHRECCSIWGSRPSRVSSRRVLSGSEEGEDCDGKGAKPVGFPHREY
jgi:hypothetical protein